MVGGNLEQQPEKNQINVGNSEGTAEQHEGAPVAESDKDVGENRAETRKTFARTFKNLLIESIKGRTHTDPLTAEISLEQFGVTAFTVKSVVESAASATRALLGSEADSYISELEESLNARKVANMTPADAVAYVERLAA